MPLQLRSHYIPWHLIIIFVLLAIGIGTPGYLYYKNQDTNTKKSAPEELSAVADLKGSQIVNWRKERLGDAMAVSKNSFVIWRRSVEVVSRRKVSSGESNDESAKRLRDEQATSSIDR